MNKLIDVPADQVPSVVKEALRADATRIEVTKQENGDYTVSWE